VRVADRLEAVSPFPAAVQAAAASPTLCLDSTSHYQQPRTRAHFLFPESPP
jgi:hypothetical protein